MCHSSWQEWDHSCISFAISGNAVSWTSPEKSFSLLAKWTIFLCPQNLSVDLHSEGHSEPCHRQFVFGMKITVACILLISTCVSTFEDVVSTSQKTIPSCKNRHISNTAFDANVIWIQNTYLVWPRALLTHFWDHLPDNITLWQWTPFPGFARPFVVGTLRKALEYWKNTFPGCTLPADVSLIVVELIPNGEW